MSQNFYDQYVREYLPIARMRYLKATTTKNNNEKEKIKSELFRLKSLREWQKKSLWEKITKG